VVDSGLDIRLGDGLVRGYCSCTDSRQDDAACYSWAQARSLEMQSCVGQGKEMRVESRCSSTARRLSVVDHHGYYRRHA